MRAAAAAREEVGACASGSFEHVGSSTLPLMTSAVHGPLDTSCEPLLVGERASLPSTDRRRSCNATVF